MLKFAIIGAGAGGQSMAAILTSKGYIAKLYDIDKEKIHRLQELKTIKVTGVIACEAAPAVITDRIDEVMDDVDVIMVVSTTDAHRSIAYACKPYLKDGQIVMLNPGHCGGALEIANILRGEDGCGKDLIIAEAGDLMYGCRSYEVGNILHTGLKVHVPVATLPASDIDRLMKVLGPIFPCLQPAANVLETGFEGAGAMLHPIPSLMNINKMDLGQSYDYYMEGITPHIADIISACDKERVAVCRALGVDIEAAEANSDVVVFREYTTDNCYLSFNLRNSPFDDVRVRQAIAYALDIDGAWEVCMDGVGQPAEGLLPSNIPDSIADVDSPYHVDYPVYEYNLEKAKELLAEAGYPDGFSCRYHVGHMAVRQAYGEFFANALGQIGIDVEIVALDAATNSQALKVEHNFDIYTWGISATNGDIDYANRFFYTDNANNIFGYSDPEMDALIDAAAMEADSAKRSELNAEIQQKVLDECVIVPIYQQEDIHCYTSDLQGFRNGAFQAPLLKYCYFA